MAVCDVAPFTDCPARFKLALMTDGLCLVVVLRSEDTADTEEVVIPVCVLTKKQVKQGNVKATVYSRVALLFRVYRI